MELGFHKTKIIIAGNSIMVICTTHLNVVFFLLFLYSEYPHSRTIFLYVLWNDKKGSSAGMIEVYQRGSHLLFIYAMPTKWCMHAEWHKYYVNIKFRLN